jgi:hypothetical protein
MTISTTWEPRDITEAFFPVELRPLFMPTNAEIGSLFEPTIDEFARYKKLQRHFAVVDVKRNHPFAVVSDDYELITNEKAYEIAAGVMKRVFLVTELSDMACLNITMPKTRSFCHIDLIHKAAHFSPWKKDKWNAFLRITNSYNRTRQLRFELGFCRWICLNGMIFGSKSVEFSYAHTRGCSEQIERFIDNINDIREVEHNLIEMLHQLKRYHVPEKEMLPLLCRVFDISVTEEEIKKKKRQLDLMVMRNRVRSLTNDYFSDMGQHGYAALNVLTDYGSRPEGIFALGTSMHGLQQKAGNWIEEFISEISSPGFSFDTYLADYRQTSQLIESL